MFAHDVDVEVEHNDLSWSLFVERLLVLLFESVESFVVGQKVDQEGHHCSLVDLQWPCQQRQVLVMAVQPYVRNVSDNTVRRFDHLD